MEEIRTPTIRSRLTLLVLACVLPAFLLALAWTVYDRHGIRLWFLAGASALLIALGIGLAWRIGRGIQASMQALVAPALALGAGQPVRVEELELKEADDVGKALSRASQILESAHREAHHDVLTGLANRALFSRLLEHGLAMSERTGRYLAVLYLDLDGFKPVNDVLGRAAGDEVLRMVGARLRSLLRQSDLVARLGGDKFAIILLETDPEGASTAVKKVTESLSRPYEFGGQQIRLSASVGIAYRDEAVSSEELLARVEGALHRAKAAGRGQYALAWAAEGEPPPSHGLANLRRLLSRQFS